MSRKTLDISRLKSPLELGHLVARQRDTGATRLRVREDQRDELIGLLREQVPFPPLGEIKGSVVWNGMEIVT